jgi:acetyl esterase/lipase
MKKLLIPFFAFCIGIAFVSAFIGAGSVSCLAKDAEKYPEGTKVTLNVPYVTGGGERQMMDVFGNADPKAPLIIWVHGGGWVAGSKSPSPASGLLTKGFSVASINYRYSRTDAFPAQLQDCKSAIRYLRAHARELGINADVIGVAGASAGGHLVSTSL